MVFSSSLFIFLFLPLTCFLYFLTPSSRIRNGVLLVSSLFFYAWGEHEYVKVMIGSIFLGWIFGILLEKYRQHNKTILFLGVSVSLGVLLYYKYFNFLLENWNQLLIATNWAEPIKKSPVHLPIGVSFFIFQIISYLIDIYRGQISAQKNIFKMGLYKSFFPQLIAGPIVRYKDIATQMTVRAISHHDISYGLRRFVWGLTFKILISNPFGHIADKVYALSPDQLTTPLAWVGAIAYFFQIYFDFCGYSHMAIGLGRLFGFHFLENFNHPYSATSVTDFWRRWHISLSSWFRDYLFIPLGGSRCSKFRNYFNLFIVFFLCGLWHGASWNFALWGIFHGLLLVIEKWYSFYKKPLPIPSFTKNILTLFLVIVGWVLFRAETASHITHFYTAMLGHGSDSNWLPIGSLLNLEIYFYLLMAIFLMRPNRIENFMLFDSRTDSKENLMKTFSFSEQWLLIFTTISLFLVSLSYLANGTFNPFIYFRF